MMSDGDIDIDIIKNTALQNYIVVDAHLDLLLDVARQRGFGRKKVIEEDYLPGFKEGGVKLVVSSLFIDDEYLPEMALRRALNQISALYSELEETQDSIYLCKGFDDIVKPQNQNKVGIILSFEGVEPLYNDMSLLKIFYQLGVRGMGLVWSRRNYAADGCRYTESGKGKTGGLTDFGVKLVAEAQRLGMFIDVSHLNDEGFWDVLSIVDKPIIASHSNCRAVAKTPRNLTDDQIRAIASKGGVIGINASNIIVADSDKDANIETLITHMDHIADLVGTEHIGLGFDFCDKIFKYIPYQSLEGISRKPFDVIDGHRCMNQLLDRMLARGYKPNDIELIFGKNFIRVFKSVLP